MTDQTTTCKACGQPILDHEEFMANDRNIHAQCPAVVRVGFTVADIETVGNLISYYSQHNMSKFIKGSDPRLQGFVADDFTGLLKLLGRCLDVDVAGIKETE